MRVLVVEDNCLLSNSIAKGLREVGFAVDVDADGENGLRRATHGKYDVILLDLMLPLMDGLSVLRQLRFRGVNAHILIMSAEDSVSDRVRSLNAGADVYLGKPLAFKELLARINALTRRKGESSMIAIKHLRIDSAAQRVWRGKEEVEFTPREYALLEFLAVRQGKTVCRADIWEHVYYFRDALITNTLNVYIGYIRKKIDLPGEPSLIQTVRGRGYVMKPTT